MIIIQPEYDGAWFVSIDGRIIEAPSIRTLLEKLGPDYKAEGYYPNGYGNVIRNSGWGKPPKRTRNLQPSATVKEAIEHVEAVRKDGIGRGNAEERHEWTKEEETIALEMYDKRHSFGQIANHLGKGLNRNAVAGKVDRLKRRRQKENDRRKFAEDFPDEASDGTMDASGNMVNRTGSA